MKRKLALFDFDDTMIRGDSIARLVRRLYIKGHLSTGGLLKTLWGTLLWKLGRMPVEDIKTLSLSPLVRMPREEAAAFCRRFVEEELVPGLYPDAVKQMQRHRDAGDLVLLVSASPEVYLAYLADVLPVDGIIATRTDGQFRVVLNVVKDEKNRQITLWLKERGIEADWAHSAAYGDSSNDLHMLGMVGKPHLVNPSRKTRKRGQGIPVLHWH